jgi:hypothetical protein
MTSPQHRDLSPQTPSFSPSDSNSSSTFPSPSITESETLHQDDQPDFFQSPLDYRDDLADRNQEYGHYKDSEELLSPTTGLAQGHHLRMLSDVLPLPQVFPDSSGKPSTPSIYVHPPVCKEQYFAQSKEDEIDPFSASFGEANLIPSQVEPPSSIAHDSFRLPESVSDLSNQDKESMSKRPSLLLCTSDSRSFSCRARDFSPCFPEGHQLLPTFVQDYLLLDQLGAGGYGFVMTARHRSGGYDVAVKFIIKDKVPENSWIQCEDFVKPLPVEFVILHYVQHENIIRCLDLFEDDIYFYMVRHKFRR